ncbi:MAG: HAD family hydrolase, partial [Streptococcus sp.]
NKYSFVQVKDGGTYFFGAYEFLGFTQPMDAYYENLKQQGFRILSLAHSKDQITSPANMKLLGHVVLSDEIKDNTKETFDYFESQGVEVTKVSDDDFERVVLEHDIFGRVTPEQKQKMVTVLQKAGKTVAMSGDGVNDVLALKKADISFAMNGATSAAKSVSNIVFLTDDFAVFYDILMEGRRVINNIQKVASLFLTKTFFSIVFAILSVVFGLEFAFIPIQ